MARAGRTVCVTGVSGARKTTASPQVLEPLRRRVDSELLGGDIASGQFSEAFGFFTRDAKGLYRLARGAEFKNFTGLYDPYQAPADPDVGIRSDAADTGEDGATQVVAALEARVYLASGFAGNGGTTAAMALAAGTHVFR